MSFVEFRDGNHGGHLGYRNGTFLAVLIALMLPADLWFNRMYVSGGFSFEEYHDDCHCDHLGYLNWTLAILNLHVLMPPPSFGSISCLMCLSITHNLKLWKLLRPCRCKNNISLKGGVNEDKNNTCFG